MAPHFQTDYQVHKPLPWRLGKCRPVLCTCMTLAHAHTQDLTMTVTTKYLHQQTKWHSLQQPSTRSNREPNF
eukprot:1200715-Amphidinium_carterae.1